MASKRRLVQLEKRFDCRWDSKKCYAEYVKEAPLDVCVLVPEIRRLRKALVCIASKALEG